MALPDLIEIIPLTGSVPAVITVPGSKSITNRALVLGALADGETKLLGALWSEDTQIMVEALRQLGFEVAIETDPEESGNRTVLVKGLGGVIPRGGTAEKPLELLVGNAGTVARFLAAFVCLGKGVYRLRGVPRMHERPQAALFRALRELGYRVESEGRNDKLPARIFGVEGGRKTGETVGPRSCTVSIEESSQFASALLLCAKTGDWRVNVVGENAEESPYVAMTTRLIKVFPKRGGSFQVEPDESSASYFWGAAWLFEDRERYPILVRDSPNSTGFQVDARFTRYWPPPPSLSRKDELADSIITAVVLAPLGARTTRFVDLGRLRVQECDRVFALRTELTKCGAKVTEEGDTLTVFPSADKLHGAEIETYNDHRLAMCFAILGLKVPGIKIKNPACVKKTFPNFFQKLAAPPPRGLGATILEATTGRKLSRDELFAD
jgi:3-phosphoshikimate 1-carboxyvinyltransferase